MFSLKSGLFSRSKSDISGSEYCLGDILWSKLTASMVLLLLGAQNIEKLIFMGSVEAILPSMPPVSGLLRSFTSG